VFRCAVVKGEVSGDRRARLADAVVGFQIDLLVFDAAPRPLDEHVVAPGTFAVHADGDFCIEQHTGEVDAGELAALIRVEYLRLAVLRQGFLQRLDAKIRLHRDRHAMRKHPPGRPVDDRRQIDEAPRHRDVGDVHRPDMVGLFDLQLAQEIGINLVARHGFAGVRAAVNCLDFHALHQCRDMAAANRNPFAVQHVAQHSTARERVIEMQFVEPPHDFQILGRYGPRLVIDGAPANAERLRLPGDRKVVIPVDHRFALSMPALVSAPSKKML